MIIFGTKGVHFTKQKGEFLCPQCELQRPYKLKRVVKFFTLYFIPIIPLKSMGTFVECTHCQGTFLSNILSHRKRPTAADLQAEFETALKHCLVMIMLSDDKIDDREMKIVQKIINHHSYQDMTRKALEEYVQTVQDNYEPISSYLRKVTPTLDEHGKETILRCGLRVALADGNLDNAEMALVWDMAETMQMSKAHVKGILATYERGLWVKHE